MFRKLLTVFVLIAILALASLACGGPAKVAVSVDVPLTPAQEKAALMDWAYGNGETVFEMAVYDESDGRYALCSGGQRIVFLKSGVTRRVKLTSQESVNLYLCKECEGGYNQMSDLGNSEPGDYYAWSTDLVLGVTIYVP